MAYNLSKIKDDLEKKVFLYDFMLPQDLAIVGACNLYSSTYKEETEEVIREAFKPLFSTEIGNQGLTLHNGASKVVIVPEDERTDYVIKLPCDGFYMDAVHWLDRCQSILRREKDDEVFQEIFELAAKNYISQVQEDWFLDHNLSDTSSDYTSSWISSNTELRKNRYYLKYNKVPLGAENYCDVEYKVYQKMKEKKIDCFFARIDKIDMGERNLYIQERAKVLSDFDESLEELYPEVKIHNWSKKAAERAEKNGIIIRAVWLELAAKTYGRKKVKRLLRFLFSPRKKDKHLSEIISQDIHDGNYGFRIDGTPCFIDYSGYYG